MNKHAQKHTTRAELLALLLSLDPADAPDVYLFAQALILSRRAHQKPPTAAEWQQMTDRQKLRCLRTASKRVTAG